MSYHDFRPTEFAGKTWIFVVQAFIFGGLGLFSLILGPLFLLEIMKDARGQPATGAGVALTIMSLPLLAVSALALFNLAARRRPLIRICREGLAINMIGSSSLDGIPLVPAMLRVAWLIITFQGFRQQIFFVPWQSLKAARISGPPMARNLTIEGAAFQPSDGQIVQSMPAANQITFAEVAFRAPLELVAGAITGYCQDAEVRDCLDSWNG